MSRTATTAARASYRASFFGPHMVARAPTYERIVEPAVARTSYRSAFFGPHMVQFAPTYDIVLDADEAVAKRSASKPATVASTAMMSVVVDKQDVSSTQQQQQQQQQQQAEEYVPYQQSFFGPHMVARGARFPLNRQ